MMPLRITTNISHINSEVSGPRHANPLWNRIMGRLSSPSQRCPRIQVCAAPDAPDRHFFARAEQSREQHHGVARDPERQPDRAAAARPAWRIDGIAPRRQSPTTMKITSVAQNQGRCVRSICIDTSASCNCGLTSSIAKEFEFGSTRCAASCGQAYTQLGSAMFAAQIARSRFLLAPRPSAGCVGSLSTSNGCS